MSSDGGSGGWVDNGAAFIIGGDVGNDGDKVDTGEADKGLVTTSREKSPNPHDTLATPVPHASERREVRSTSAQQAGGYSAHTAPLN